MRKKVLLYLGKFPGFGVDIDGGSILARQLIDTLKEKCILDVVFIRKHHETFADDKVNNIRYVEYLDAENNKFTRRLENLQTNREALKNYDKYDVIVTAHISKFFGMEEADRSFWGKTVLFPMFCTSSYIRAGEVVPEIYTKMEDYVIKHVKKIITPSNEEAEDLCRDYHCDKTKINIITRGITPLIKPRLHGMVHDRLRIISIASIKPQKNNIALIDLLDELIKRKLNVELHFVCTIYEKKIYQEMISKIKEKHLDKAFFFHIAISQEDVAKKLQEMDINISVSNWETFGRGIFEGIRAGLPTFVPDRLKVIKRLCGNQHGIYFSESLSEMADQIIELKENSEEYESLLNGLVSFSEKFSYETEKKKLLKEIIGGSNG